MRFLRFFPIIFLLLFAAIVFRQFIFQGRLPIPADTIVGMYYPGRDLYSPQYPNGVPFKNSLITDVVRQTYPWRKLAIDQLKNGQLPLWNPYSFSGYPLMANLQSAPFYPANMIYWLTDFSTGWSIQIMLQIVLGGLFMLLFLKNLKLREEAVTLGALAWAGSGFFISWLESNVPIQSALWLPLALWAIDKRKGLALVIALGSSVLAGHLQIFSYVWITAAAYAFYRRNFLSSIFFLISSILVSWWLIPAGQFILSSNRAVDQSVWLKPDWFLPWQNLVQFVAPDFFGNPATGNYFGVWNYMEFVGYIGIIPLIFAMVSLLSRNKKTFFWLGLLAVSLIFALPTPLAKLPFQLNIPFLASAQPSRLIVLADFCLAILSAFGLDYFLGKKSKVLPSIFLITIIFAGLWIAVFGLHLSISLRNLYFPSAILVVSIILLLLAGKKKVFVLALLLTALIDSSRFAGKFLSFSSAEYLYPPTKVTTFLQENLGNYRFASLDDRIMPANFSVMYGLQDVGGYDPLYLKIYSDNIPAANRMISIKDPRSPMLDLLGVKYVLALNDINLLEYTKVFQDGETRIYENTQVFPRAFFINGGQVEIKSYQPNEILIRTNNTNNGSLVLTDTYHPSWKAQIDGQTANIETAYSFLRQVKVQAGEHIVRFYL